MHFQAQTMRAVYSFYISEALIAPIEIPKLTMYNEPT